MRAITRSICCAAIAALPASLLAQGVTIQQVDGVHLYGAFGKVVSFAARLGGGRIHDDTSTMFLSGHKLAHETANDGTIVDADAGRFTAVDKKNKTYTSMTFDDMAKAMQQAADSAKAQRGRAVQQQSAKPADAKSNVDFKTSVAVDRTAQHKKIAGYDAERSFLTITITATAKSDTAPPAEAGTMVFFVDEWRATSTPAAAQMAEFQRAYVNKAGQAFQAPIKSLQAAFSQDARIKTGFDAAAKEMQKAQGMLMLSNSYVALVPPGLTFDRSLALGGSGDTVSTAASAAPQKKQGRFGGLMGKLKEAAAAANATSNDTTAKSPPKQTTLLMVSGEVRSITIGAVSADHFAPPAGYTDVSRRP